MDAHNTAKRIFAVAIALGALGLTCPVYARLLHYGGRFELPIPSPEEPESKYGKGWMADAIINVTEHITIIDIDVAITLVHSSVFDLQIFLQGPDGTQHCLNMYNFDEFFIGADYSGTIFDDEAEVSIRQANPPFTGSFRPRNTSSLELFEGCDAFGAWRLRINDMYYANAGRLESFELMITETAPEPATVVLLVLGTMLAIASSPVRRVL